MRIGARVLPGDAAVEIAIADTGPGIDPAVQSRICDPFFTTKFTGRGLGLSAALGIMKAHHGTIHVASALGADTVVTVVVPAVDTVKCA